MTSGTDQGGVGRLEFSFGGGDHKVFRGKGGGVDCRKMNAN